MNDIRDLLRYIDPAQCSYQEWVNVGMALKEEGLTAADWDNWSRQDTRYKRGECFRKWETFNRSGSDDVVTGGTIYELAMRGGYVSPYEGQGHALEWDDYIRDEGVVVDVGWIEETEFHEPEEKKWKPVQDLITYLQTLFQSTDYVGYVTDVYEDEDRLSPKRGVWDRTAGQLIEALQKCRGDIGKVIGDTNDKAGAWIRFNPVDGQGVKNDNVTEFRYALVESDKLELGRQEAIMRQLELPIAAMVYSGKKSIHAIVKVEATDYQEYKKRVEYLYQICNKNGLVVDTQNKNPSRLSRMPGVIRDGHKQFLMATNIGRKSWQEWAEWIEAVNDDLPDPEDLSGVWNNIPALADCLIDGILRKGHKMLLVGPSKAGKSFALIELTIAIAEGRTWLGLQCAQGRVLYVNLELDRASCLHRFKDVYSALGLEGENIGNIDVWNLRGKSLPMDKLAPKLIRRAEKKNYTAVIIDPIYKIITGDENNASEMANFCNQFDKVCTSMHCAVIYCHHHSKGSQGQKKSMDRASGSGVFARDPDTMLDMTELTMTPALVAQLKARARCRAAAQILDEDRTAAGWRDNAGQDELLTPSIMDAKVGTLCSNASKEKYYATAREAEEKAESVTAWRIEGILREFPLLKPINAYFNYPVHELDGTGELSDLKVEDTSVKNWREKGQEARDNIKELKIKAVHKAFKSLTEQTGKQFVKLTDMIEYIDENIDDIRITNSTQKKGLSALKRKNMLAWIAMCTDFECDDDGIISAKNITEDDEIR